MPSASGVEISNPFGAGVTLLAETTSTMDEARSLAQRGAPHGSVVVAERQTAGRGRTRGRSWLGEGGKDLLFTVQFEAALLSLEGFPLRVGLGVCRAVERLAGGQSSCGGQSFLPEIRLKWPNDLLIDGKKAAGILCEGSGGRLYAGVGINCGDRAFPPGLRTPPTSLEAAFGRSVPPLDLLPLVLGELKAALEDGDWRREVERRLFLRGQSIRFRAGDPQTGRLVEGRLLGLGPEGELLIAEGQAAAGGQSSAASLDALSPTLFASGEILL